MSYTFAYVYTQLRYLHYCIVTYGSCSCCVRVIFKRGADRFDMPVQIAVIAFYMTFVDLETGLKLDEFSGFSWIHARSCAPPGEGKWLVPGPSNNNSRIPQTDSGDPETETLRLS